MDSPEGRVLTAIQCERRKRQFFTETSWPTHAPLVVGNSVLMRTAWNLSCFELQTGKKLWAVPGMNYQEIREQLLKLEPYELAALGNERTDQACQLMNDLLMHQLWGEAIYGDLSSDGKHVFCIEDTIFRYVPIPDSVFVQRLEPANIPAGENAETDPGTVPNRLAC